MPSVELPPMGGRTMDAMTQKLGVDVLTAARQRIEGILDRYDTVAVAFRMSDLIRRLVNEHKVSFQEIERKIGAYKGEVELLYKEDVWERKGSSTHVYSDAWKPRDGTDTKY